MAALPAIAMAATVASTVVSGVGTILSGSMQKDAAEYEARQREKQANEARAVGQKRMFEQRRQTDLAQSRLRAVAASTTGDTTDPTVMNLAQGIEGRGEYNALTEFAMGENRARGFEDMASAARYKGKSAQVGSYFKTAGTIFDGLSSFGQQYKKNYG